MFAPLISRVVGMYPTIMTKLVYTFIGFLIGLISVSFGWAVIASSSSVVFVPSHDGWVSLMSGAVRDANGYRNESKSVLFDWVDVLDADVAVSVQLLPDSWFRYRVTVTNRSAYPLRECRLLVGKQVRRVSDGWIHDRDAVARQWNQVDGQLPYQVLIQVGSRSGTANLSRFGLMPSASIQLEFESPDPPRPSWALLRADGWVYNRVTDRMGVAPQNAFVRIPTLLPVSVVTSPAVFLDTLLSTLVNNDWLRKDMLVNPTTRLRWYHDLANSFNRPTHSKVVQDLISELQEQATSSPLRDMALANLMYYHQVMIPTPSLGESPSANFR